MVPLGPRYDGTKISRDAMAEGDEEDDPFARGFDDAESDEEEDLRNGVPNGEESDEEDHSGEEEGSEEEDDLEDGGDTSATDLSDEEDEDDGDDVSGKGTEDQAELRKMMAEEQKTVAATLSQAAKADAEKGRAVKQQRTTFDALLNTRIKLQKALISTNTMTGLAQDSSDADAETPEKAFQAAEKAAFSLWSSLNDLRECLISARVGKKRKHAEFAVDTPTADLWSHMQSQESESRQHRNNILEKWSAKARGATTIDPRNRLNNTASQQTIVDVLQEQLTGSDRLIKRTRMPRSCAPLQLSRKVTEDVAIYDDADFYGLLLQSLLEQRSADSVAASMSASNIDINFQMRREAKTKKNVDTKASKGRKLRYTVHEKLQNYMAPEDRATWGGRQVDELFGSLFGRQMGLGEEEEEAEEEDKDMEEAGLMLFRS